MLEAVLKMHLIINKDGNYMFKVNNRNIRTSYGMCSKLTIKKLEKNLKKYCISSQKDSIINVWKRQKNVTVTRFMDFHLLGVKLIVLGFTFIIFNNYKLSLEL